MIFPALHGNWIDLIIILVLTVFALDGRRAGLWRGILNFGNFILSFLVSLRFYSFFGKLLIDNFSFPKGIGNALGFFAAGWITELLFSYIVMAIYQRIRPSHLLKPRTDQTLGILPALGEGLVLTAFFLTIIIALPVQGYLKKDILDSKIGGTLIARTQTIEKQLNGIFAPAISETLNFITVKTGSSENVNLKFTQKEVTVDAAAENTMFNLVNEERTSRGLNALVWDHRLRDLGRAYGKDMFARGYFSHYNPESQSPFDRMKAAGIEFTAAGENLALAPNVQIAHTGLMNSPGHRANILGQDFGKIGIGAIDGGIYGEIFVQEFTN